MFNYYDAFKQQHNIICKEVIFLQVIQQKEIQKSLVKKPNIKFEFCNNSFINASLQLYGIEKSSCFYKQKSRIGSIIVKKVENFKISIYKKFSKFQ
ncbi:unnamed protein product [Paramecium octaurelia]|uniref:Uncharacterized protein n=1 Tax=Paramecium octaurelia TaxID=43137 RepID=A0A8S1YD27_PAROT|nr:unnamed protein product [Paramecium octaurelia]